MYDILESILNKIKKTKGTIDVLVMPYLFAAGGADAAKCVVGMFQERGLTLGAVRKSNNQEYGALLEVQEDGLSPLFANSEYSNWFELAEKIAVDNGIFPWDSICEAILEDEAERKGGQEGNNYYGHILSSAFDKNYHEKTHLDFLGAMHEKSECMRESVVEFCSIIDKEIVSAKLKKTMPQLQLRVKNLEFVAAELNAGVGRQISMLPAAPRFD
jgi:hypothetical protein